MHIENEIGDEPEAAKAAEEIRDDDDDVDDFIEYADGERPLRRPRGTELPAELAEAREEAEAIFGTEQEMQELLNFTHGGESGFPRLLRAEFQVHVCSSPVFAYSPLT